MEEKFNFHAAIVLHQSENRGIIGCTESFEYEVTGGCKQAEPCETLTTSLESSTRKATCRLVMEIRAAELKRNTEIRGP